MKDFKLIEHNLIPFSLFVLNMSIVHLIYLLFMNYIFSTATILIFSSNVFLIAGVLMKNKVLMIIAGPLYLLTLACLL